MKVRSLGEFDFERVNLPKMTPEKLRAVTPGITDRQIADSLGYFERCEQYISGLYHVAIDKRTEHGFGPLGDIQFWHLSIKRHDREPMNDWREMQRIKTEICGPDAEAVQLYPAEDRVVDTANQFHLYVLIGCRYPFGFPAGARSDNENGGSRQRPGSGGNSADAWTEEQSDGK